MSVESDSYRLRDLVLDETADCETSFAVAKQTLPVNLRGDSLKKVAQAVRAHGFDRK